MNAAAKAVGGACLAGALAAAAPARAVGLDGPEDAATRVVASVGAGWDQVGGYGRDGFAFTEVSGLAEARVWRGLTLGIAATGRRDFTDYNFALERFRGGSTAFAVQAFVGYDGPAFHVSLGPWLYGDDRDGRRFRAAFSPWGVLRLRFGHLDRWHVTVRALDGAPFTAAGAATGVLAEVGAPPASGHRVKAGVYTSVGETTIGVAAADEVTWGARTWRAGVRVGTDLGHFAHRPELMLFVGAVL